MPQHPHLFGGKGVEADDVKARLGERVIIILTRAVTKSDRDSFLLFLASSSNCCMALDSVSSKNNQMSFSLIILVVAPRLPSVCRKQVDVILWHAKLNWEMMMMQQQQQQQQQ
jgi:hypothetical protein